MKGLLISTILILNITTFAQSEAKKLFNQRNYPDKALEGSELYSKLAIQSENKLDKCFYHYRSSYLRFIYSDSRKNYSIKLNELVEAVKESDKCFKELGITKYDRKKVLALKDKDLMKVYALNLQNKITSIARIIDIKANDQGDKLAALRGWRQHISPAMNLLIQVGQGDIYYHAPYRVLGIAYNEMPSIGGILGDKKLSETYLKKANSETLWPGKNISKYIYNSIAYSDLLFNTKRKKEACLIINEILEISDEEAKLEIPELFPEFLIDYKRAKTYFENFNC